MATTTTTFGVSPSAPSQPLGGKAAGIIMQGATEKKLPTNAQVTAALDSAAATIAAVPQPSKYGARMAADMQAVINTSKALLEQKNANDLLQRLSSHIKLATNEARAVAAQKLQQQPAAAADNSIKGKVAGRAKAAKDKVASKVSKLGKTVSSGKMEQTPSSSAASSLSPEVSETLEALKSLALTMANSGELRSLLLDLLNLTRDTAKATTEVVKRHRTAAEDALHPLQETTQKTSHQLLEQTGPAPSPAASTTTTTFVAVATDPVDGSRTITAGKIEQLSADPVQQQPQQPTAASSTANNNIQEVKQMRDDFRGAAFATKDRVLSVGRELKDDLRRTYKSEGFPINEQRKQQLMNEAQRLFDELIAKPELVRSLKALISLADARWPSMDIKDKTSRLDSYMRHTAVAPGAGAPQQRTLTAMDQIMVDVRMIIAQWTGAAELDSLISRWTSLVSRLGQDAEARDLFRDFRRFLDRAAADPAAMKADQQLASEPMRLFDRFVSLISRFRDDAELNATVTETRATLRRIQNDAATVAMGNAWRRLWADMVLDEDGRINFLVAKDSLDALRRLAVPLFSDQFAVIPMPAVNHTSPEVDVTLSNMTVSGLTLLPSQFSIHAVQDINVDLRSAAAPAHSNRFDGKFRMHIRNFTVVARNAHFAVHKKTGFPKLREEGDVDVTVGGPKSDIMVEMQLYADADRFHVYTTDVKVHLDRLHIRFAHLRRHSLLLPFAVTAFNGVIKSAVEKQIQSQLLRQLNTLNGKMDSAVESARMRLRTLPGRIDAQLRRASDQANVRRLQARKQMKRARKQFTAVRTRTTATVQGAYKPFVDNRGMPLADRAKMAAENVRGTAKSKRSRKSTRKAGSVRSRSSKMEAVSSGIPPAQTELNASAASTSSTAPEEEQTFVVMSKADSQLQQAGQPMMKEPMIVAPVAGSLDKLPEVPTATTYQSSAY